MMRHPRFSHYATLATVGLASLLVNVFPVATLPVYAQSSDDSNQGLPPGTVGGGSRGPVDCNAHSPLVAFAPETNLLKTLATQPTLWVYLPDTFSFEEAEFVLYDENEATVIDTVFTVADQSGLMKIDLAAIAQDQALEPGQNYRWFFSLVCPDNRAADVSVDGWLNLTPLATDLANQLDQTHDPIDRANLYISADMWSEALTTLVSWHESPSPDLSQSAWDGVIETLSPVTTPLNLTTAYRLTLESD
ncbi:MAG: DUF928 domain-containing protein [Leptolyngbyaceae cyanobacterium]